MLQMYVVMNRSNTDKQKANNNIHLDVSKIETQDNRAPNVHKTSEQNNRGSEKSEKSEKGFGSSRADIAVNRYLSSMSDMTCGLEHVKTEAESQCRLKLKSDLDKQAKVLDTKISGIDSNELIEETSVKSLSVTKYARKDYQSKNILKKDEDAVPLEGKNEVKLVRPNDASFDTGINGNEQSQFENSAQLDTQNTLRSHHEMQSNSSIKKTSFNEEMPNAKVDEMVLSSGLKKDLETLLDSADFAPLANEALIANNDKENSEDAETLHKGVRVRGSSLLDSLPERFQVLLCEVAGLNIAIPLLELGGIHKLTKISPIAGKPAWFKGILIKGDEKYNCIDAAKWIMPERYTPEMAETINYKFAIQLGKTPFVLCCESIHTTLDLTKTDVKWLNQEKKRPWLAGLIKEKMCALIDGTKMIELVLQAK